MKPAADRLIGRAAVIASAGLVLALVLSLARLFAPGVFAKFGWGSTTTSRAYAAGQTIDLPPDLYRSHATTVILFARVNCSACERARPFDRDVAALVAQSPTARMVIVSPDAASADLAAYASSIGLNGFAISPWPSPPPRVAVVPTIVVVDQSGRVLDAWEGVGTKAEQAAILERVRSLISR